MWWSCSKAHSPLPPEEAESSSAGLRPQGSREDDRREMVERTIRARGIRDSRVLSAIRAVPRHEFVPHEVQALAYADQPLPIGEGQTISQPYIVALMTELAELQPGNRCLEIGTGCGYQTAVLAEMGASVVTLEIKAGLAKLAEARLRQLGYSEDRVQCHAGDGSRGFAEAEPYDAIVVTAAAPIVPDSLLSQLADGGRLVLPVGPPDGIQRLEKWVRRNREDGKPEFESAFILNVQFVPLRSNT